jgi:hypothetical protein
MNQKYVSYYFRNLCARTFPAYGVDSYYDICIYEHFIELLLRISDSEEEFNMLLFMDKYLKKIDSDKSRRMFEEQSTNGYDAAKRDFLIILSNIYQITLIYNHRNDLAALEDALLELDGDRLKKMRIRYDLDERTVEFLEQSISQVKNALMAKVDFAYDIDKYNDALDHTLLLAENELSQLQISDIVSNNSPQINADRQDLFESCKIEVIGNLQDLSATIGDVFFEDRKIRHLKRVDYYLSFLLHDEIISGQGSKKILKNLYKALVYAYKMQLYFLYFKDKHEKATLAGILEFFGDESIEVGIEKDYTDRRVEEIFFNIVNNIEVRRDFKHLPLIILGYQLALDAKTVEKMSIQLDNGGPIDNNRTKNPNVIVRFNDLKYSANDKTEYDLNEDIQEFLELFSSFRTQTAYETNVIDEEGEFTTISFDSEEEYIAFISPDCEEGKIQYMVDNFLSQRDKKVYFEPLFE